VFILAWGSALGIVQRRDPSAEGASHSSASSIWRYATNRWCWVALYTPASDPIMSPAF